MFGWLTGSSSFTSRPARARLRLEPLEDRTVPSADPLEPPVPDPLAPTEPTVAPAEPPTDPSASAPPDTTAPEPTAEASGWGDWTYEDWQWFELYVNDFESEDEAAPPDEAPTPAPEATPAFTPPVWFARLKAEGADAVTLQRWVDEVGGTDEARRNAAADRFEALDTDRDDRVSLAELEAATSATGPLHRALTDANWMYAAKVADLRDGTLEMLRNSVLVPPGSSGLTRATWDATLGNSLGALFEQLDEDGDGILTHDDVIALGESGTETNLQLLLAAQFTATLGLLPDPPVAADRIAPTNTPLTNAEIVDLGFVPANDHPRLSRLWLQNNGYFIDRAEIAKMKAFKDHGGNVLYNTDEEYKAVVDAFASLIEEFALPGLTDGPNGPIDRRTDFFGFVQQVYRVNYTGTALTWDQASALGQLTWPLRGEIWRMQDRAAKGLSRRALEFTLEFTFGAGEAVAGVAEAIWNIRELPTAVRKLLTDENAQEALWQQLKKSVNDALEGDPRALGKLTVELPMAVTGAGAVVKTGKVVLTVTTATGKAIIASGKKGKDLVKALLRADREAAQAAELSKVNAAKWGETLEQRVAQATKLPDEAAAMARQKLPSYLANDKSIAGKSPSRVRADRPANWKEVDVDRGHGWKLVDENNIERIRYMYPKKDGRWAHEQTGYFRRQNANGDYLDMHGKVVPIDDPLFHVKTHIIPEN